MAVRVKLSDVARRARVSAMSVSNYMNGRHGTMTEETRDRIAEAVTVLNYRPDMAARSVRTSKIQSVGLIVVDESPTYLSDGYTTQLVSGLGDALNAKGYTLQLEGLTASRLSASTLIRQRQTDGLCVLPTGSLATRKEIIRTVAGTGQPFVLLLESLPRAWPDACCVLQTDRQGARELARHVLERGARDLVVLKQSHNHWQAVAERQVGIEEAVAQFGEAASLKVTQCGSGDVAATVLGLPGEALTHGADGYEIREFIQDITFAGLPFAFHELDDADPHAMAECPHDQSKCSG
mgnify:CR=1 FL=1